MWKNSNKDSLVKWSKDWLLRFHPDKCVSISFGNNQNPTYYMDDHELRYSPCEKDLEVYIDDEFNFEKHIGTIVNKANRVLGNTRKTFDHMDQNIFC